jgi:surface antigen/LysM repeat protein
MDHIDYTFKFSTEIIVLVLSFVVVALNFTGTQVLASLNSGNLFAKELAYHPGQNKNLYAETTTVKTVVAQSNGNVFIQTANADTVITASSVEGAGAGSGSASPAPSNQSGAAVADGNSITKVDTGSAHTLVLEQVKVYVTQPGDTLQSIAQKYGITTETIVWANNLPSNTIAPGWDLLILPTSGVLYKVTANDTLPDLASYFNADINQIISYNNLSDESDVNTGDILIIPGGTVPAPKVAPVAKSPEGAKPKPAKVKLTVGGKVYYEPAPPGIQDLPGAEHQFPWGQCTYYVAEVRHVTWGGNARSWLTNAAAAGAKVGRTPIPGAIMVSSESRYGHVAVVDTVSGDSFTVTEMNYKGLGIIDTRTISLGDGYVRGFIY